MERNMGLTLAALRRRAGWSQAQLAARLRASGIAVTNQAVSKWETGQTIPNAVQFLVLCRLLKVEDVMGTFSGRAPEAPARLNAEGRRRVAEFARILEASGMFAPTPPTPVSAVCRVVRVYRLAVSAGTGQLLDGEDYEMVEVGEEVPKEADFGVRIAGDSMHPRFCDGQTVWVRACQTLRSGETGVVFYDGNAYCKILDDTGTQLRLCSVNTAYPPICIDPACSFRVFGKVLG